MKRQELYKVRKGQEILGKNLTVQEYCDLMEDIAQEFYEGKFPNPLDLTTEIQKEYEEVIKENENIVKGRKSTILEGGESLSSENQEEVQNIFVPILPIPLNNVAESRNLQSFQVMFLLSLKRIIKPVLVLLVGDRASSIITTMLERDDQEILKENNYFSIPELQYMISVPEVKKTVWEEWQQKRRIINNDLFL